MLTQGNNVIKFEERKSYHQRSEKEIGQDDTKAIYENLLETNRKLDLLLAINEKNEENEENSLEQKIAELEKENEKMNEKIKNSFPIHIITYLVVCSLIMGINLTLLVLRVICKIYTFDPYYIICALLIAATLFFTALVAIKDWKGYLDGKEKR